MTANGGYSETIPGLKMVVELAVVVVEAETYLLEKKNNSMIFVEEQFNNSTDSKVILDARNLFTINKTELISPFVTYALKSKGCQEDYQGSNLTLNDDY